MPCTAEMVFAWHTGLCAHCSNLRRVSFRLLDHSRRRDQRRVGEDAAAHGLDAPHLVTDGAGVCRRGQRSDDVRRTVDRDHRDFVKGSDRLDRAIDPLLAGYVFGFTWGIGYPVPLNLSFSPTELSPNEALTVEVYREPHDKLGNPLRFNDCGPGNLPEPLTAADVEAATFMTMGHEVGHALHVCHTGDTAAGGTATTVRRAWSFRSLILFQDVMYSATRLPIPRTTDPGAQYSPTDAGRIRLHVRQ